MARHCQYKCSSNAPPRSCLQDSASFLPHRVGEDVVEGGLMQVEGAKSLAPANCAGDYPATRQAAQ